MELTKKIFEGDYISILREMRKEGYRLPSPNEITPFLENTKRNSYPTNACSITTPNETFLFWGNQYSKIKTIEERIKFEEGKEISTDLSVLEKINEFYQKGKTAKTLRIPQDYYPEIEFDQIQNNPILQWLYRGNIQSLKQIMEKKEIEKIDLYFPIHSGISQIEQVQIRSPLAGFGFEFDGMEYSSNIKREIIAIKK